MKPTECNECCLFNCSRSVRKLDKEVVDSVATLNSLPGVRTFASCSGHGYDDCYIGLRCSNFESLKRIVQAVYGIRWKCGDNFDSRKHLWVVVLMPHQTDDAITLSITWQGDWGDMQRRLRRIKMRESWQELEVALQGCIRCDEDLSG